MKSDTSDPECQALPERAETGGGKLRMTVGELTDELVALARAKLESEVGPRIEERLRALEKMAHEPVDFAALVGERAELIARLWEVDPHGFSSRPCQTCSAITAILGRDFGCDAYAKRKG